MLSGVATARALGGGCRKWQNLAKLLAKLPQHCARGAAGRTDRRTRSRTYSCACAAADARKPHVREAAWQLRTTMRMRKVRILDELPPEVLSLVLSQLLPQDMLVQKCSRRWRDKDLDVLYWKPLFLNTFGEAAQTTKRARKARSREWRDRYERAWRLRVEPRTSGRGGTCALGLHLGRLLSSYDHRVRPTNIFHAIDGQGVLSVPDVRGKELELRYYIHDEAVAVGAFEVDVDVWLHPDDDVDSDAEDPVSDTMDRRGHSEGSSSVQPLGNPLRSSASRGGPPGHTGRVPAATLAGSLWGRS